ncbi:M48 family metalloprotease [Candidatus Bathyarchaeota archaeon]|nr:M48 family metalloprotease [Candidatus Bathyarchaeota archaeon]
MLVHHYGEKLPGLWKLRLSMIATLAVIIGLSTLVFTAILSLLGTFDLITLGVLVVIFNIGQWLISPYIIDALYQTRELPENENPKLHEILENLSRKSGIKKPRLMLAQIPLPNAFAYGSPIAGNRVAVTAGLLKTLDIGEVEAVIGHELGHLKHRDVQIMMFVSLLPALFYYIGYSLILSSMFSRQREGGGGSALIGMGFMAFSWILNIFILYLSRLREYYADRHSASIVENGAQKLSEGLAKIVYATKRMGRKRKEMQNLNAFKALFIADPDRSDVDSMVLSAAVSGDQQLVQELLSQKLTTLDKIIELFSTHPNIVKRLKALQELS